jgi:hypothetical protein
MRHIKLTGGPSEGWTPSGCYSPPACGHPPAACLCRQKKSTQKTQTTLLWQKGLPASPDASPKPRGQQLPTKRTANSTEQIQGRDSLTCEDEPLLVRRDTLLVLNFRLDHVDGVGRLHLQAHLIHCLDALGLVWRSPSHGSFCTCGCSLTIIPFLVPFLFILPCKSKP